MAISPEKEKALAAAMSQIDRKYGKGSIMKVGEAGSRLAGLPDEPGAPQALRRDQQIAHGRDLPQPAAYEDRRDVRLARDDDRRPGAEVLRLDPPGHPPDRDAEVRPGGDRHARARQS